MSSQFFPCRVHRQWTWSIALIPLAVACATGTPLARDVKRSPPARRSAVDTANAPAAIGPYSQAVVYAGVVYCSGQIGIDPATGQLVEGGVRAQAERALQNLKAVLEAAGTGLDRALKCTIYLTSMDDFAAVNEVYAGFFGTSPPARATVGVARLPKGALIEIDCSAATL